MSGEPGEMGEEKEELTLLENSALKGKKKARWLDFRLAR